MKIKKEYIDKAKQAGACEDELEKARVLIGQDCKNAKWAYWYARDVIKGRWPEVEDIIKQDAEWACWYAYDIIKGRWPKAERLNQ